jgi:hypothetical protein
VNGGSDLAGQRCMCVSSRIADTIALAFVLNMVSAVGALACDELASRLIDKAIRSQIESLDCGILGRVLNVRPMEEMDRGDRADSNPEQGF